MAKAIRDKAYYDKTTYGCHTAGRLAESVVYRLFYLQEPYVEIKACQKRHLRVVIKKSQVDRWMDKTYVVVVYDRRSARLTGNRLPFEEAFENRLIFLFITGAELLTVWRKQGNQLRDCYSKKLGRIVCQNHEVDYRRIIEYLVERDGAAAKSDKWDRRGHDVYGTIPPLEKQRLIFPNMHQDVPED